MGNVGSSPTCSFSNIDAYPNQTFHHFGWHVNEDLAAFPNDSSHHDYDVAYRAVNAIMTVFLPSTNISSMATIGSTQAHLNCVRITDTLSATTRDAPALPKPMAVRSSLSKGAIAGIVIGCVVGAAVLAGGTCMLWWQRRRRARPFGAAALQHPKEEEDKEKAIMLDGQGIAEAEGQGGGRPAGSELEGWSVGEVQGSDVPMKGDRDRPVELDSRAMMPAENPKP